MNCTDAEASGFTYSTCDAVESLNSTVCEFVESDWNRIVAPLSHWAVGPVLSVQYWSPFRNS